MLLKSEDGGANWAQISLGWDNELNSIFFVSQNQGWVVGSGGLIAMTNSGGTDLSDGENSADQMDFLLQNNFPNPFNPQTLIDFTISKPSNVSLTIFDMSGSEVRTLVNSYRERGSYREIWNGKDNDERQLSTGPYLYQLRIGDYTQTKKMLMLR